MDATNTTVDPAKYLPIADYDSAQRDLWIEALYKQKIVRAKSTPLNTALARVGRHYAGVTTGMNAGMIVAPTDDPVQYSCQRNFALLTTDGFYNDGAGNARAPDDSAIPNLDNGSQCRLGGGPACPPFPNPPAGNVARPFNDAITGTSKGLTRGCLVSNDSARGRHEASL